MIARLEPARPAGVPRNVAEAVVSARPCPNVRITGLAEGLWNPTSWKPLRKRSSGAKQLEDADVRDEEIGPHLTTIQEAAREAVAAGLCPVPNSLDGSERHRANGSSGRVNHQDRHTNGCSIGARPSDERDRLGLRARSREISNAWTSMNQESYERFVERASDWSVDALVDRVARRYRERTPKGGVHLLCRCPAVSGSPSSPVGTKGGRRTATRRNDRVQVVIETRGTGGYIVVAPSCGRVHPSWQALRADVRGIRLHRQRSAPTNVTRSTHWPAVSTNWGSRRSRPRARREYGPACRLAASRRRVRGGRFLERCA